jgi:hypothetical protein
LPRGELARVRRVLALEIDRHPLGGRRALVRPRLARALATDLLAARLLRLGPRADRTLACRTLALLRPLRALVGAPLERLEVGHVAEVLVARGHGRSGLLGRR